MIIKDYITITEVSDSPTYRHRGMWAYNNKVDYYQWGQADQKYIDTVIQNGSLFLAIAEKASLNAPPSIPMSNSYWEILIAKGYTEEEIKWHSENIDTSLVTALFKNNGSNGVMDAKAITTPQYIGNAFAIFTVENLKSDFIAAFGDYQPECGVHIVNGILYEIQKGEEVQLAQSALVTGDQIGLEYADGQIRTYKNGVAISSYLIDNDKAKFKLIFTIATKTTTPIVTGIRFGTYIPYVDWVHDWDGNKTLIGDSYVVSPKAFIGQNNPTQEEPINLTGVALGIGINGLSDGTTGIAGYNQNTQTFIIRTDGSASFGVDSPISSQFRIAADGSATIKNLNATNITAGTLSGAFIDARGLVVRDERELETFIVSANGNVDIRGEIKSMNYINDDKTGYALLRNGKAILNEAIVRGSVILPNAGITNFGESEEEIRIWAGSNYEGRGKANFRVSQNGDLFAKKGTFGGRVAADDVHTGTIHMSKGAFIINNTVTSLDDDGTAKLLNITPFGLEEEYIHLEKDGSMINTDLLIGNQADKRIEFLKNAKSLTIKDTDVSISGRSIAITFDRGSSWSTGFSLSSTHANQNAKFSFGYSSSESWTNTLIISGNGTKSTSNYGDICFRRENSRDDIDISILGNLEVRKSISSSEQNIEMRSVRNEGWGFYLI